MQEQQQPGSEALRKKRGRPRKSAAAVFQTEFERFLSVVPPEAHPALRKITAEIRWGTSAPEACARFLVDEAQRPDEPSATTTRFGQSEEEPNLASTVALLVKDHELLSATVAVLSAQQAAGNAPPASDLGGSGASAAPDLAKIAADIEAVWSEILKLNTLQQEFETQTKAALAALYGVSSKAESEAEVARLRTDLADLAKRLDHMSAVDSARVDEAAAIGHRVLNLPRWRFVLVRFLMRMNKGGAHAAG